MSKQITYQLTEDDLRAIAVRIAESDNQPLDYGFDHHIKPMSADSIYDMLSGTIEEYVEAQVKANAPYVAGDAAYQLAGDR